jgi:hypothetical protein
VQKLCEDLRNLTRDKFMRFGHFARNMNHSKILALVIFLVNLMAFS